MVVGVKVRPLFTRPAAVWHHLQRLHQYNSDARHVSNNSEWRGDSTNSDACRGNRQRRPATAWVSGRGARGKEEPRRQPGRMPVISTRAPSYRRGPAEAHCTKWWNQRTAPY